MNTAINVWTKILIVEQQQILVYKEFDGTDEEYKLRCMVECKSFNLTVSYGFANQEDLDSGFGKFDEESAAGILKAATSFEKENTDG